MVARNFVNTVVQSHNRSLAHYNRGTESGIESIMYMAKLMLQNHGATKEATDEFLREVTSMKAYKDIMKGAPRCPNIGPECTTFEPTDPLANTTPVSPMPTAQTTTQSYNESESGSQSI